MFDYFAELCYHATGFKTVMMCAVEGWYSGYVKLLGLIPNVHILSVVIFEQDLTCHPGTSRQKI